MPISVCVVRLCIVTGVLVAAAAFAAPDGPRVGYYRFPALHANTVVFTSEGDLWSVDVHGGSAQRLTSNAGTETRASIAPDGRRIAFLGQYEGPSEVYTMPIAGGVPERMTWDGDAAPAGWSPDGRLLVSTQRYAGLPQSQLVLLGAHGERERLPLAQGADGAYADDGHTLFFTRWRKQSSSTKRYRGGTAESLWRFDGHSEAVPLTADYQGTSRNPMIWNGRVYFLSDRDGIMNVFSMAFDGKGVRQESHQRVFDVLSASLADGRIVYACAGDLWLLNLTEGDERALPISLRSDFEQLRETWVKKPLGYLSSVHLSPDGSSAVFTARGEVFTLPARSGRIVKVAGSPGVRFRDASYLPDGKSLAVLSTQSGETEFWKYPAAGGGAPEQWTHDAKFLRWDGTASPDGHWFAHRDKDQQLWVYDIRLKHDHRVLQSPNGDITELRWSPDSRWLAFVDTAGNQFTQIKVLDPDSNDVRALTSDRYNSSSPSWSTDGKWLYFLSDRQLKSTVESPWGARQPEPHFDRSVKLYELALLPGLRSPFLPADELHPDSLKAGAAKTDDAGQADAGKREGDGQHRPHPDMDDAAKKAARKVPAVRIDFNDLAARLAEVPAPAGNYESLQVADKRLCWLNGSDDVPRKLALQCLDIQNKGDELENVTGEVKSFEISLDRKKILVAKEHDFYILDADAKAAAFNDPKILGKATINLSRWVFNTQPRQEFVGIFEDAWRLERDYFYDRKMHGVDWTAVRERYRPLVGRVSDRDELNDIIAQMVGELSALHIFVHGGDTRKSADQIDLATLGARLRRDEKGGGFVVEHVYRHDPDRPDEAAPLARPESRVRDGETVLAIDGEPALDLVDERQALRGKAGVQVLLRIRNAAGEVRDVLVTPVRAAEDARLRYAEWEYSRRLKVEADSNGSIGYVHLRAMGAEDIAQWAREYYPVFDRQGLIIDVRHNRGGNIDSWLLANLLRQAWFYWQPRTGDPIWNMQYAFRGHIVVLCDETTASDGEAFTEGFKRFKLGTTIGTRTWGGEIWLNADNFELDGGIATAAELGVYGPERQWLIEGHGVEPDMVVDNLPYQSFDGRDAQLQAALDLLKTQIRTDPRPVPLPPPYPDKSFKAPR
jgi:tricorn protease